MAEDQDSSQQRTEEPTPKRLEEALKKGNVAFSREVTSFILMLFFTLFVFWVLPSTAKNIVNELSYYITSPHDIEWDEKQGGLWKLAIKVLLQFASIISIPLLLCMVAALFGNFIQNGFLLAPDVIMPDLGRISIFKGFSKIFSLRSVIEFSKSIFKISIVAVVLYFVVRDEAMRSIFFHDYEVKDIAILLFKLVKRMLVAICIILGFIAVIDFAYQKYDHLNKLKMSRQEVKDEMRQSDGDPEVKAKIRALRLEKAKRRMMKATATATVIITNPEHYSVALKYIPEEMSVPIVVAKGVDEIALKIREVAKKNRIPIVRNPPLARALYATCDLDDAIPYEQYQAVAAIITKILMLERQQQNKI